MVTIGVVDYKMGNHASVVHCLRDLNYRVCVSDDLKILDKCDVLILPGVGAYPSAMLALHERNLVTYLQARARANHPIIGICLGMQLLAEASHEIQYTAGLGLIPGEVVALDDPKWHIGWNTLECLENVPVLQACHGRSFYFNHSYVYQGPTEYQVCVSNHHKKFPSVIQRGSVIGVQFHPEKSQAAGRVLLKKLITGMHDA